MRRSWWTLRQDLHSVPSMSKTMPRSCMESLSPCWPSGARRRRGEAVEAILADMALKGTLDGGSARAVEHAGFKSNRVCTNTRERIEFKLDGLVVFSCVT